MAIFTFSTKTKKPDDEALVIAVKEYCDRTNKNFSGIVIDLLRKYKQEEMPNDRK